MKFWIAFMIILAILSFQIASLNVLSVDGLDHYILLTSNLAVTFCGRYRKDSGNAKILHTAHEIKEEIKAAVNGITPDSPCRVVSNFRRLQTLLDADGSNTEPVFHC
jgi:hypothetical protein